MLIETDNEREDARGILEEGEVASAESNGLEPLSVEGSADGLGC